MIRKSLVLFLLAAGTASAAGAQTGAPAAKSESRVFSFAFDGDGGYLGVQTEEVTKENFSKFGLREVQGVAVQKVMEGSPAQTAGLQAGDVIVKFNGDPITSVRKLTRLISDVAPDHQVKISVLRNGDGRELTATLAKRPMPRFEEGGFWSTAPGARIGPMPAPGAPARPALPPSGQLPSFPFPPAGEDGYRTLFRGSGGRQIGIGITPLTKQLAEHYQVPGGVLVTSVRENSPAAKAGLKAGDIIIEVEGKELKGDGDLLRMLAEKKEGDVQLTVVRDGNRQTFRVTPEVVVEAPALFHAPDPASFTEPKSDSNRWRAITPQEFFRGFFNSRGWRWM